MKNKNNFVLYIKKSVFQKGSNFKSISQWKFKMNYFTYSEKLQRAACLNCEMDPLSTRCSVEWMHTAAIVIDVLRGEVSAKCQLSFNSSPWWMKILSSGKSCYFSCDFGSSIPNISRLYVYIYKYTRWTRNMIILNFVIGL